MARVVAEFGAQILDVRINRALVAFVGIPLDAVEQVEPREGAAGVLHQHQQQVELGGREIERLTV